MSNTKWASVDNSILPVLYNGSVVEDSILEYQGLQENISNKRDKEVVEKIFDMINDKEKQTD